VGGEDIKKGCRKVNIVEILFENGKMRPVEAILGVGGWRKKMMEG
jgi:hypothetical protein